MGEIYLADGTHIKETKVWRASRIRDLCRERGWFDKGSNKEFDNMFKALVFTSPHSASPATLNIYLLAHNIYERTSNPTVAVEDIMTAIANGAVATFYRIQQGIPKPGFTKKTAEQFLDDWEAKQFRKDWGDGEPEEEARHEG